MEKTAYSLRIRHWIGVIQEANSSDLTHKEWCMQNGISRRQFYYWQKKVREYLIESGKTSGLLQTIESQPAEANLEPIAPVFCEVPLAPRQRIEHDTDFSQPELVLNYGPFQLLVGGNISERTLTTVIAVIRHA